MYEKCIEYANKAAYSFQKRNPTTDPQDILAQARLIMMDAIGSWEPDKGRTLESWVSYLVNQELPKTFKAIPTDNHPDLENLLISKTEDPERIMVFRETINNLSTAAKEIVQMLFSGEIGEEGINKTKQELKAKLRELGYSWNKIQEGFRELKELSNSFA